MSIALVVTRGFANGTLTTEIKDVITAGFTLGAIPVIWTAQPNAITAYTKQTDAVDSFTSIPNETSTWVKQ